MRRAPALAGLALGAVVIGGCGVPIRTARDQPHVTYPSAPPPEATETAYTRELRRKLAGSDATPTSEEAESVDAVVQRLYR